MYWHLRSSHHLKKLSIKRSSKLHHWRLLLQFLCPHLSDFADQSMKLGVTKYFSLQGGHQNSIQSPTISLQSVQRSSWRGILYLETILVSIMHGTVTWHFNALRQLNSCSLELLYIRQMSAQVSVTRVCCNSLNLWCVYTKALQTSNYFCCI